MPFVGARKHYVSLMDGLHELSFKVDLHFVGHIEVDTIGNQIFTLCWWIFSSL